MRVIGIRTLSCTVAAVALTAAAALATAHLRHLPVASIDPAVPVNEAPADPLARELARCRSIGLAAKSNTTCEVAWAKNRRRFFTYTPSAAPAQEAK